jgi:sodium/hydrogen exchanger 8
VLRRNAREDRQSQVVALISETYVFVYLGMAAFAFPIWNNIGFSTALVGLLACFVGRLHVYVLMPLINCFRPDRDGNSQRYH